MDKLKLYYEKYTCLESNEITTFVNRQTFFFMGMTFLVSGYSSTDSLFIQLMISLCSIIYTIIFKFGFIKASICALHKLEVGIKKIEQCVDSIYDSKYKIENCSPQIVRSKIIDTDGKKISRSIDAIITLFFMFWVIALFRTLYNICNTVKIFQEFPLYIIGISLVAIIPIISIIVYICFDKITNNAIEKCKHDEAHNN